MNVECHVQSETNVKGQSWKGNEGSKICEGRELK